MNRMYKLLLLTLICGSLSACTYSVNRLVRDEPLREKLIKDCVGMGIKAKDSQNCINAAEAQFKVTGAKLKDLFH